jgi:Cdc6-like AAA superfamily ATPase
MYIHVVDFSTLEAAIGNHFEKYSIATPAEATHIYKISEEFTISPQIEKIYWKEDVRSDRFDDTKRKGILYRPEITDKICNEVIQLLDNESSRGLMIKGPHGIGKSHSIVNVVRKLVSSGDFLVTFIPDCAKWKNAQYLVNAICASFGAKYDTLGLTFFKQSKETYDQGLPDLIDAISKSLEKLGKRWVFVFDQINRLFVTNKDTQDSVIRAGQIISVISASANNEVAYKDNHPSFVEHIHKASMSNEELRMVYGKIKGKSLKALSQSTGNLYT